MLSFTVMFLLICFAVNITLWAVTFHSLSPSCKSTTITFSVTDSLFENTFQNVHRVLKLGLALFY